MSSMAICMITTVMRRMNEDDENINEEHDYIDDDNVLRMRLQRGIKEWLSISITRYHYFP